MMLYPINRYTLPTQTAFRPSRTSQTAAARPSILTTPATDTVHFGSKQPSTPSPVYEPSLTIGEYGLPPGHLYEEFFKAGRPISNLPGVAKVDRVRSLDPSEKDPAKAYASELTLNMKGTRLAGKTTPGEHISILSTSDRNQFSTEFRQKLRQNGPDTQFTEKDLSLLKDQRYGNFSIASPKGGETDWLGRPNGKIKLIIRRVEKTDYDPKTGTTRIHKGPLTNFLVNLKKGDGVVFAAPQSHHFLGPKAETPSLFLGVGSSVAPYIGMLETRFEQEKGPYAETYLGIGHTVQGLEYRAKSLRRHASKTNHQFTYRPVYSRETDKESLSKAALRIFRNCICNKNPERNTQPKPRYVQELIQQPQEAEKIFRILLNPKSRIYISGFIGFDQQIQEALKKSALNNPQLGITPIQLEEAIEKAKTEKRYLVEGDIRRDMSEGLQGY